MDTPDPQSGVFAAASRDPAETRELALCLARAIGARGLAISLIGPLGAGKTLFAKGLAEGLGIDPNQVASPTYVIQHRHRAPDGRLFAHVDLYRLESEDELEATGFIDCFEPGAVVVVEWGDRLPGCLPGDHLELRLARVRASTAGSERLLEARGSGGEATRVVAAWREAGAHTCL